MPTQTFWITGASRGIGKSIAILLHQQGQRVILTARSAEQLSALALQLGDRAIALPCDISQHQSVHRAYQWIKRQGIQVDGLINNAGVGKFAPLPSLSVTEVEQMIHVNLLGAIYCTMAVLPDMIKQRYGIIVNVVSVAAITPFSNAAVYAASKAGLQMFGDALRQEVRNAGIRVINVLPGATATAIWDTPTLTQHRHRMMNPDSVAAAIVQLLNCPTDIHPETLVIRPVEGDL